MLSRSVVPPRRPRPFSRSRPALALAALLACPAGMAFAADPAEKAENAEKAKDGVDLPLSRVVMFNSGVAFYEHLGDVKDTARVDFKFRTESINDLLKSMVLRDLDGGKISTITYASQDPLRKMLGSFAVDLTSNPTLAQLLTQIRGEGVEVDAPNRITGTIVSIETKKQLQEGQVRESQHLNLLTETGLRSIPLDRIARLKLVNAKLDAELRQALAVLALGHADDKKTVSLSFDGEGKRRVQVGYIQEAPIWKTSYRLVLSEKKKPFLQGWAIVENTTEQDWKNVGLTLVSGRPISFRMDLYTPLYVARPLVEPELYASLRPQTYDESFGSREERFKQAGAMPGAPPQSDRQALAAAVPQRRALQEKSINGYANLADGAAADKPRTAAEYDFTGSVQSAAQGSEVGELFQYAIDAPVTLPRRQSAMLPIVNDAIEIEKVGIYNPAVQAKHPLNGLRIKNTSGLNLLQGPITVFDDGAYAGDARILDMAPNATRLVSYALDLDTEVAPERKSHPDVLTAVKIFRGTLEATTTYRRNVKFTVKNRGTKPRKILIEHPLDVAWKLVAPNTSEEKTRDLYRFAVSALPGVTAELNVEEERSGPTHYRIVNTDENTLRFFISSTVPKPEIKQALEAVIVRQQAIAAVVKQRNEADQELKTIDAEQARIRENMRQIPRDGDLYARYVKKFNTQEDLIETRRQTIKSLIEQEQKLRTDLNKFIEGLTL